MLSPGGEFSRKHLDHTSPHTPFRCRSCLSGLLVVAHGITWFFLRLVRRRRPHAPLRSSAVPCTAASTDGINTWLPSQVSCAVETLVRSCMAPPAIAGCGRHLRRARATHRWRSCLALHTQSHVPGPIGNASWDHKGRYTLAGQSMHLVLETKLGPTLSHPLSALHCTYRVVLWDRLCSLGTMCNTMLVLSPVRAEQWLRRRNDCAAYHHSLLTLRAGLVGSAALGGRRIFKCHNRSCIRWHGRSWARWYTYT